MPASGLQRQAKFKSQARRQFDGWADSYDKSLLHHFLFRPSYLAMMEEIAKWRAGRTEPFDLLDIGCGTGALAGLLAGTGWPISVCGLDYSPAMCAEAHKKSRSEAGSGSPVYLAGDSEHLPFAAGSFDLVICMNSFHHYPHQDAVVNEMRRVLRPGGSVVLVDGFRDNAIGWFIYDVVITRIEKSVYHVPWHEVHTLFEKAGLVNIRRSKHSVLFPVLMTVGDAA